MLTFLARRTAAPLRTFVQEDGGNVAMIFALCSVVCFGVTGLAIDFGRAMNARTKMQQAADGAALSAASTANLTDTERITLAKRIFSADHSGEAFEPTVKVSSDSAGKKLSVSATRDVPATFSGVIGFSKFTVAAEAKALVGIDGVASNAGPACLLALETSNYGFKINGGGTGSHLTANCPVHGNSSYYRAIFGNNKSTLTSTRTTIGGDFDTDPTFSPTPIKNSPAIADPLAGVLTAPSSSACSFNNTKVNSNQTKTLNPGVHCGGIDIGSSATVTFNPGTYVIKNGQFKIGSSAKVTGNGVFFYLVSGNARFIWGSHAEVNFKAPTSGTYKGMLLWSAESLSNAHEFGCHAQSVIQGTVYSPKTEIQIGSWGDVGASADWTVWIVKSIEMSSHAHLKINANYTGSPTPTPDGLLEKLTPQQQTPARLL